MNSFRYWIKRKIFLKQLQKICDKKGFSLSLHRDLLTVSDGNDNERDFSLQTKDSVLSVKLIPIRKRAAILRVTATGTYSIAEGTVLPQGKQLHHKRTAYRFENFKKLPEQTVPVPNAEGKTVRHILLVHPSCYEYQTCHADGSVSTVTSGDTFLGWELWCGRDFREMLKKL